MTDVLLYILLVMIPGTAFLAWMWHRDKSIPSEADFD